MFLCSGRSDGRDLEAKHTIWFVDRLSPRVEEDREPESLSPRWNLIDYLVSRKIEPTFLGIDEEFQEFVVVA